MHKSIIEEITLENNTNKEWHLLLDMRVQDFRKAQRINQHMDLILNALCYAKTVKVLVEVFGFSALFFFLF